MNFMGVRVRKVGLVCWRRVEERREGVAGETRRRLEVVGGMRGGMCTCSYSRCTEFRNMNI